ncbi:MAG: hypothetical protein RIQ52_229 [Pseudomonadota bacterium]|jgi:hypothetical protein
MTMFLVTFAAIGLVILMMAVGVIFGRSPIKGSCGGTGSSDCVCVKKCEKRLRMEAENQA